MIRPDGVLGPGSPVESLEAVHKPAEIMLKLAGICPPGFMNPRKEQKSRKMKENEHRAPKSNHTGQVAPEQDRTKSS